MDSAVTLTWSLFPFALFGCLFPLRYRARDDHFILVTVVAVSVGIAGPRALIPVGVAFVVAVIVLLLRGSAATVDRQATMAARRLDVARLVVTVVALGVAVLLGHLLYVGVFHARYPIDPSDPVDALEGIAFGFVGTGVSLGVRVLAHRLLWGEFRQRDPDSFENFLAPYLTPYVACAALVASCISIYRPEHWWTCWIGFCWVLPIHFLAHYDIRQRHAAEAIRQQALARQRLAAIGEISAKVLHQSRHQVGLMGWCTHRIRLALESSDRLDRATIGRELDALDAARDLLAESLSAELAAPGAADTSGSASVLERPAPATTHSSQGAVPIDDLVDTIVGVLGPKAARLGVRLESGGVAHGTTVDRTRVDASATAHVVPEALHDALFNLVDNALDAAEGCVRVNVIDDRGGPPSIEVIDDGAGLSVPEPRAFEPFVTTKPMGTGMGLAIAEAIVGDAGGHLTYRHAEGRTTFTIDLPTP